MWKQIRSASRLGSNRSLILIPKGIDSIDFDDNGYFSYKLDTFRLFSTAKSSEMLLSNQRYKFQGLHSNKTYNFSNATQSNHSLVEESFRNEVHTDSIVDASVSSTIDKVSVDSSDHSDTSSVSSVRNKGLFKKQEQSKKNKKKFKSIPDQIKSRRRRKIRTKTKKIRKLVKLGVEPSVPLQTARNAEFLFDTLAPCLEIKTLEYILELVNSFCDPGQYARLAQHLSGSDESSDSEGYNTDEEFDITPERRLNVFLASTEIIAKNQWLGHLLSHFLMGKLFFNPEITEDENNYNRDFPSHPHLLASEYSEDLNNDIFNMVWNDSAYTANINKEQLERNVQILMDTRVKAAEKPLRWAPKKKGKKTKVQNIKGIQAPKDTLNNYHCLKTDDCLYDEAQEMALLLADRLPELSHNKLYEMLYSYAHDGERLTKIDKDGKIFRDESGEDSSSQMPEGKKKRKSRKQTMKNLFPRVKQKVYAHTPFIIRELADFLYVDVPTDDSYNKNTHLPPHHPQFSTHDVTDEQLHRAWQKWYRMREKCVKSLTLAQHQFAFFDGEEEKEEMEKKTIDDNMESVNAGSTPKVQHRRTKGAHVVFDAISLGEESGVTEPSLSHSSIEETHIDVGRTVFLNNLPIDVTEEELTECYERCGPISSLKIYNLRPDLDPGKRSSAELKKIRKKQRLNMKPISKCTPVYAHIHFSTDSGFEAATNSQLMIFGMVIRRHAVKSIPASEISNIFIENIPSGYYSLDLEYKLNKALQPRVYVCLDSVNGIRGRESYDYTESKSCKIKFPSFEAALFAYDRLQTIDILQTKDSKRLEEQERCQIQWMRTPSNAMKFWKREITFDS